MGRHRWLARNTEACNHPSGRDPVAASGMMQGAERMGNMVRSGAGEQPITHRETHPLDSPDSGVSEDGTRDVRPTEWHSQVSVANGVAGDSLVTVAPQQRASRDRRVRHHRPGRRELGPGVQQQADRRQRARVRALAIRGSPESARWTPAKGMARGGLAACRAAGSTTAGSMAGSSGQPQAERSGHTSTSTAFT